MRRFAFAFSAVVLLAQPAAADQTPRHGLSIFGDLQYPLLAITAFTLVVGIVAIARYKRTLD